MIDLKNQSVLRDLFCRKNHSFLQYVNQMSPWAPPEDRSLLDLVSNSAIEENELLRKMAIWLDHHRIPIPYLGAFPTKFTHYNYVGIRKMMKPLTCELRGELAALESEVDKLTDADSRWAVNEMIELSRRHLQDFERVSGALDAT